jgi:hypothetical protein
MILEQILINLEGFKYRFLFFLPQTCLPKGETTKIPQRSAKIHMATALKARPVTAMGANHGIEVQKDSPPAYNHNPETRVNCGSTETINWGFG